MINTTARAYVLLDSWVESVETVSTHTLLLAFILKNAGFFFFFGCFLKMSKIKSVMAK